MSNGYSNPKGWLYWPTDPKEIKRLSREVRRHQKKVNKRRKGK